MQQTFWAAIVITIAVGPAAAHADGTKKSVDRTGIPPITAKRWMSDPPPIPKPRKITRKDYFDTVAKFRKTMRPARLKAIDNHTTRFNSLWARREAFLQRLVADGVSSVAAVQEAVEAFRREMPGRPG